jgi:prevent-host-death family protein
MKKKSATTALIDISTADLRKSLGEILDRVQYSGSRYIVSRKGREIGAIVPVELAQRLELLEKDRAKALQRLNKLLKGKPSLVKDEDAAMALANELVGEVRASNASR